MNAIVVAVSLCVSAGVHAAIAGMHAGRGELLELAAFEAAAMIALISLLALGSSSRVGAPLALVTLVATSLLFVRSIDQLGIITITIQVGGAVAASTMLRGPSPRPRAPMALCALIVAYSFLAAHAIPTIHHANDHQGHEHAQAT